MAGLALISSNSATPPILLLFGESETEAVVKSTLFQKSLVLFSAEHRKFPWTWPFSGSTLFSKMQSRFLSVFSSFKYTLTDIETPCSNFSETKPINIKDKPLLSLLKWLTCRNEIDALIFAKDSLRIALEQTNFSWVAMLFKVKYLTFSWVIVVCSIIIVLFLISLSTLHESLSWSSFDSHVRDVPSGYVKGRTNFGTFSWILSLIFPIIVNIPVVSQLLCSIDSKVKKGTILVSSLFLYFFVITGSKDISSFGTPHILSELLYLKE